MWRNTKFPWISYFSTHDPHIFPLRRPRNQHTEPHCADYEWFRSISMSEENKVASQAILLCMWYFWAGGYVQSFFKHISWSMCYDEELWLIHEQNKLSLSKTKIEIPKCDGMTLAGCQVPTRAALSLPSSTGQVRENIQRAHGSR